MSGRSPGRCGAGGGAGGAGAGSRCLLILQRCLAIQLQKVALVQGDRRDPPPSEYWMYDSGYLLFQGFLEANLKCFWNASLLEAMRLLEFQGYVAPGVLLVTASACALEVVRAAWSRNVLKAPSNYAIAVVGDVEDCLIQPLPQGQFTPLPEALCWVILDLTSSGQAAVLERIRSALEVAFPDMQKPSSEIVYDALAKLMADRKVYQTSQGYFVVTPERRRREPSHGRRHSRSHLHSSRDRSGGGGGGAGAGADECEAATRPMLMSTEEAVALVHGEMATIRDGDVTHQAVQTNLADVICGGNPNDKILYPRATRRSSSFPLARLERRHSLRLFGSSKRLSNSLSRCGSLRHLPYKLANHSDSSSSTEGPVMLAEPPSTKKASLLSRLFRRSGRKRGASAPPASLSTFSAQFPPTEWFNPRVVHLHSVGTQTRSASSGNSTIPNSCRDSLAQSHGTIAPWTDEDASSRAATLPRRHRRHASGDSAMSLATNPHSHTVMTTSSSTPRSSRRHRSPSQSSTLPRRSSSSNSTSRTSVLPHPSPSKTSTLDRHNQSPSQSSVVTSNHSTPNKSLQQNGSMVSFNSSKSISSSPCKSLTNHSNRNSPSHSLISSNRASPSKIASSSSQVSKSNSSSRHSSPAKGKNNVVNGLIQQAAQKEQTSPSSKSSITLQVSAMNRSSPPSTSGYSSHYQSSTGRSSVLSSASTVPYQEPTPRQSVTVTSESPTAYGNGASSSTTTTTTTVNGSNTKIYVQQQNSPVRSVITFENGVRNNVNGCVPSKDIIIINGGSPQHAAKTKEATSINGKCSEGSVRSVRPRLERPTSLYSPREVLKAGLDTESTTTEKTSGSGSTLERRRFPSVESLNCSEVSACSKEKLTNNCNYNNISHQKSSELLTSPNITKKNDVGDGYNLASAPHPNAQPPSTPTSNDPTMNNARVLPTQATSPALPAKNKDGLNFKNVLRNESLSNILASNGDGLKNNFCSNPSSPTKTFDNFGGSYGNLYIEQLDGNDKLLSASMKNLEERSNSDLCPYPSLNDLTVHFKSIAAQKILKGVSINSIDTLVEVNMAAAEKQNNCDVTIHTDFGVV